MTQLHLRSHFLMYPKASRITLNPNLNFIAGCKIYTPSSELISGLSRRILHESFWFLTGHSPLGHRRLKEQKTTFNRPTALARCFIDSIWICDYWVLCLRIFIHIALIYSICVPFDFRISNDRPINLAKAQPPSIPLHNKHWYVRILILVLMMLELSPLMLDYSCKRLNTY